MPTRFWGDAQRTRYGRFPEAAARAENSGLCATPIPNRTFATPYLVFDSGKSKPIVNQ